MLGALSRNKKFIKPLFYVSLGGVAFYAQDSRASIHNWLTTPLLHQLDAEDSHKLAIKLLSLGIHPKDYGNDWEGLKTTVWGKHFDNPVGLAAGFDKHAEAIDGLFDLGFGFVEVGSVTPEPQSGNEKPRMFRLEDDEAVINRYGFNSVGHLTVLARLRQRLRKFITSNADTETTNTLLQSGLFSANEATTHFGLPSSLRNGRILSLNLGKNKTTGADDVSDYVKGVKTLGPFADMLVINVSSPNTPGLRGMQRRSVLENLLSSVVDERQKLSNKLPILVKVAPDLGSDELEDVGLAAKNVGIDGVVVSNTTIDRPSSLTSENKTQVGGLSGKPLLEKSVKALKELYISTDGQVPLVGCGGISSGKDALKFAGAGASLVQLYTALGYQGVGLPRRIKDEIADELKNNGIASWQAFVGTDALADLTQRRWEKGYSAAIDTLTKEVEGLIDRAKKLADVDTNSAQGIIQKGTSTAQEIQKRLV
ncbi:dihydroorotate oxidase [Wallemia mellicola]|uniref:Dihydroorotate dehydrogenase (quinone), mitochondrial n=1 Tax=Wallemia mellicola TaxID=1708541 RepID=A0A4T0TJJ9_9BASI|nr:dihydroorotate oxidase [Wallemia mellicola]